jgi:hypothetical protein
MPVTFLFSSLFFFCLTNISGKVVTSLLIMFSLFLFLSSSLSYFLFYFVSILFIDSLQDLLFLFCLTNISGKVVTSLLIMFSLFLFLSSSLSYFLFYFVSILFIDSLRDLLFLFCLTNISGVRLALTSHEPSFLLSNRKFFSKSQL